MALAITDDHAAQESAFYDAPTWQRSPHNLCEPTKREVGCIEKLQAKMQAIGDALDDALDAGGEDKAEALQEEGEAVGEQLQALEDGLQDYSPNVKAATGAIVTIDRNGEAGAKALRTLNGCAKGSATRTPGMTKATRQMK